MLSYAERHESEKRKEEEKADDMEKHGLLKNSMKHSLDTWYHRCAYRTRTLRRPAPLFDRALDIIEGPLMDGHE
ncbi:MAG: hypothetical protein MZV63_50385 [Marinilabiliales bacterium]|nr:hypothetical protein [Marinilabiliales bacterium]